MFSSRFRVLIPFSLLALALTATPGYSTTTQFSNFASWNAAATILQTIDFEGQTTGNKTTSQTINNAAFIGYNSTGVISWMIMDTSAQSFWDFGTHLAAAISLDRPAQGSPLPFFQITLPSAVTAFAADIFTSSPNGLTFAITVDGTPFTATTNLHPNPPGFFGVTSDTPFTTVNLTLQGTSWNGSSNAFIDNVRYGTAQSQSQTPEAVTSLLIGSGSVWIGFMRRRAKTNPTLQPA